MDGILVIAKEIGPTSHDVVALVRRLSGTRRVGHSGTLDPFAGGVLAVFLGSATKMLEYHLGDGKSYRATVCFGATSTTDDREGELTPIAGAVSRAAVEGALGKFRGPIDQTPPAFSAVKVAGRRAYAMARAGEKPVLAARRVEITRLDLLTWDDSDPERPIAVLDLDCSAGTYIRALARDLGAAVGNGAYLGALTRTASGPFALSAAHGLDEIRAAAANDTLSTLLLPPDFGLDALAEIQLSGEEAAVVEKGGWIAAAGRIPAAAADRPCRLRAPDGRLLAVGHLRAGRIAPDKVLVAAPEGTRSRGSDERPARTAVEEELAAEADPPEQLDADPASPDDV